MINRVKILLSQSEYNGLLEMANQDIRSIPDEIHFILLEEMKLRGLKTPEPIEAESAEPEGANDG